MFKNRRFVTLTLGIWLILVQLGSANAQDENTATQNSSDTATAAVSEEATVAVAPTSTETEGAEDLSRWQFVSEINAPEKPAAEATDGNPDRLMDFLVTPDIFAEAAPNLSDIRVIDAQGLQLPFALRVLAPKSVRDVVPSTEFNRTEPANGLHELTLDLGSDEIDHNEVSIQTSGTGFRRAVKVDGSADGKDWKPLASGHVVQFPSPKNKEDSPFEISSFDYPNSRHRFIRVQVSPDGESDEAVNGKESFSFLAVNVIRQLELPGEMVTTTARLSAREPSRQYGTPASRWIVDLGGENIPCNRLEVDIQDDDFARDGTVEIESVNRLGQTTFASFGPSFTWQRLREDQVEPMIIDMGDLQIARLRLTMADYRNKPLTLSAVRVISPARQIVLKRPIDAQFPLRVFFGNPDAEAANYDFARNLPEMLDTKPVRATLSASKPNADYVPKPKAFTERFPWLIYVALSSVGVVLGAVIVSLSRSAIARHDAMDRQTSSDAA